MQHYKEAITELLRNIPESSAGTGLDELQAIFWKYSAILRELLLHPAFSGFEQPGFSGELAIIDNHLINATDAPTAWSRSVAFYDARAALTHDLRQLHDMLGAQAAPLSETE